MQKVKRINGVTYRKILPEVGDNMRFYALSKLARQSIQDQVSKQKMTRKQKKRFHELKVYWNTRPASL